MKTEQIQQTYEVAKARYADLGIDTEPRSPLYRKYPSRSTAGRRTT